MQTLSPAMKSFIRSHTPEEAEKLLLAASRYPEIDVPFAVEQLLARRQVRDKLPSWHANEDVVYPSRLAAEQCSSEATARYKQALARGGSCCDLTGGLGVDAFYFAQRVAEVTYVERFAAYCEAAAHNFAVLGAGNIRVVQGDARELAGKVEADTFYIDPARRGEGNRRVFALVWVCMVLLVSFTLASYLIQGSNDFFAANRPEGTTEAQIFEMLEKAGVATVEDLEETAANYDFKFSFLQGVLPLGDPKRLEGYLFPDTYEFYMGEDPVSALNKMILRFDEIFTDQMRADIQAAGHTINDAVIIASMIERETDGQDQAQIASVIYNRLDNPTSETAGYLNVDATILYATGGTVVDLNADTPYNTHTHTGLPPTAIACPGVDALRAAVYPEDTSYYFYALGDDGLHHFFRTYQGQQDFIATQERYQ